MRLGLGLRLSDVVAAVRSGTAVVKSTLVDGLVSYWSLDETSGTRADLVGDNDLTDNNTVGYDTGKNGNAASLTAGNEESLTVTYSPNFTAGVTVSAWVKYNSDDSTYMGGVGLEKTWPNSVTFALYKALSNYAFLAGNGSGYLSALVAKPAWNEWALLIGWLDPDDNKLRISVNNGDPVATDALTGTWSQEADSTLAIGKVAGTIYSTGLIDEAAVWSRVLTSDERTELYNSGSGKYYNATSEDFEE